MAAAEAGLLAQPKRAARGCATAAAARFGCFGSGCFGGREVRETFGAAVVDADSVLRLTRQRKMRTHVPLGPSRTRQSRAPDGRVAATKEPAAQNTARVSASAACMHARKVRHAEGCATPAGLRARSDPLPSAAGFRSGSGRTRPGRLNQTNRPVAGPYVHIDMDNITCKYGDRWIDGWMDG